MRFSLLLGQGLTHGRLCCVVQWDTCTVGGTELGLLGLFMILGFFCVCV